MEVSSPCERSRERLYRRRIVWTETFVRDRSGSLDEGRTLALTILPLQRHALQAWETIQRLREKDGDGADPRET